MVAIDIYNINAVLKLDKYCDKGKIVVPYLQACRKKLMQKIELFSWLLW